MATVWTVVVCTAILSTLVFISAREPSVRDPNKPRFLDTRSLDRGQWLAFGIAIMTFFWGGAVVIVATIRATVPPPNTARPSYPVSWLLILFALGLAGALLALFPLLRLGWFRRRVVLDVQLGGMQAAGVSHGWVAQFIDGLEIPDCELFVHIRHLLITNRAKHDAANLLFRLYVEKESPDSDSHDVFPCHVRERLEQIALGYGAVTLPLWADDCHTGPLTIPADSSMQIDLCFIQVGDYPFRGPSGWPEGRVPVIVRELGAEQEQLVQLRLMDPPSRLRFIG